MGENVEVKEEFFVEGMTCVSCASHIESALKQQEGVLDAAIYFTTGKGYVIYDRRETELDRLLEVVRRMGYEPSPQKKKKRVEEREHFISFLISFLLTLPLLLQMIGKLFGFIEPIPAWIIVILATIVQFWCGRGFYASTFTSLKAGTANMDVLIAMGTSAAYGFSLVVYLLGLYQPLYFDSSAIIITLVLLGRWLEARSKKSTTEALEKLIEMQPQKVKVAREGHYVEVPIEEITSGEIFLVRSGDKIAVDGEVVEGESSVDESLLTGESMPVFKEKGTLVFAGTINQNGSLKVKATQVGRETKLSQMIKMVEQAQNSRAPIQKLADSVSEVFVPIVLACSLVTLISWWLSGYPFSVGLINAVSVLVIACPCALGLATPVVIMVATGEAAKKGTLFKEAEALETTQKMALLIADKTGTLTEGHPSVQEIMGIGRYKDEEVIQIAASIAHHSQHPLAEAILRRSEKMGIELEPISGFTTIPGKGMRGVKRGTQYSVGSLRMMEEQGLSPHHDVVEKWESMGRTVTGVWSGKETIGYLSLMDRLKDTSYDAVERLQASGIKVVMMTGDAKKTAEAIAKELHLQDYYAEVLPEQKASMVRKAKQKGTVVGMVGDGINDAPALATAEVGFAVDTGSDVAIEAADVTLLYGDLMGVVRAYELSKRAFRKIRQNLFFAFFYNCLGIPIAALGFLNPVIAAAAMSMSSLCVIGNALLLKSYDK